MLSGGKNYLTSHDCLPTVIFRLLLYCPLLLSDSCCRAFSVFLLNTNLPVFLRRLRMFRESVLCAKLLSERKEKSDVENVTFGMFLCVHMACIDIGRNKRDSAIAIAVQASGLLYIPCFIREDGFSDYVTGDYAGSTYRYDDEKD